MCYTLLFLLRHFLLPHFSNSIPSCSFHTIYCTTAPYSGNLGLCSPRSLFPYSRILCILLGLQPPTMLSIPPCSWLLLLKAASLFHNVTLSSPISFAEVPSLLSFFHSSLDTLTSCVFLPHTWSIVSSLLLFPVFSPFLPHIALSNSSAPQTYSSLLFSFSALLHFYTSRWDAQTSHIAYTFSLLFLLVLPLVWPEHAFCWA